MKDHKIEDLEKRLERLEYILEGCNLGSWDWWLDTNKVAFDRRWCEMLGLDPDHTPQELSTWDTRVHPDDKDQANLDIKKHLNGETLFYENVHRMRHEKGYWVWILDRGRVSERNIDGTPSRFTGTHLDISDYMERDMISRDIQRIANIGGWELDVATQKTRWTDQTYLIHKLPIGTPTEKIMGISFYPPTEQPRLVRAIQDCINGSHFRDTFEFRDAEGTEKYVEVTAAPIKNAANQVVKLRGTFQDITNTKKSELNFQKQKTMLESLMKNTPGMVYQFRMFADGKMQFDYVSDKAFEIYEISPQEFKDNPSTMLDMVAPDLRESLNQTIQESARNLTPFEWEGRIICKSGRVKWIHAQSLPRREEDQSILWDGVIMNVSERKELERKLDIERSKTIHQAKLASLGEMSAGIAHEINNPLSIISGNIALLKKLKDNPEEFNKKIDTINRAALRIEKIVMGLKKFSRSSDQTPHRLHSLKEVLLDALVFLDTKALRESTDLTYSLEDGLAIECDPLEIEQVLINFVSNAIDAVKNLSSKWVNIKGFSEGDQVVLQIIDSGPGISESIEEKLFQPFFTTKPIGQGTGLGLSIAKGILDQHKATVSVNRSFPTTCFELRFPKMAQSE